MLTEYLDGIEGRLGSVFGAVQNHGGAVFAVDVTIVTGFGHGVQVASARAQGRVHVGYFTL